MIAPLATLAGLELRSTARRLIRAGLLLLIAAVFALGACAYGLSALSTVLSSTYGAVEADMMIGAGLAVVALLLGLTAWLVRRQPKSTSTRAAMTMAAAPLALGLGRSLGPTLIKATPLVLVAGLLAGRALGARTK